MRKIAKYGIIAGGVAAMTLVWVSVQDSIGKSFQVPGSPEHMHLLAYIMVWFVAVMTNLFITMLLDNDFWR